MPVSAPVDTGVDGRLFTPSEPWLQALAAVRARERRLRSLLPPEEDRALLRLAAPEKAREAPRDLRERERVLRCLREGTPLPQTAGDLFRLREAAAEGDEFPGGGTAVRFRREGEHIPFSGDSGIVRPGWETVPPERIPRETESLLRFLRADLPCELKAVSAYFLLGRIHPFRDGNGRTLRMLYCMLLSGSYSVPTLLSALAGLQANRVLLAEAESRTNGRREDLSGFGCLLLRVLGIAQYKMEIILQDRI